MKVAFGAAWERKNEVRELVQELDLMHGVVVVSTWHTEPDEPNVTRKYLIKHGLIDLAAIRECEYFVRLTDDLTEYLCPSHLATGGHHFETGYAYALGKVVIVVGGAQNIFDSLPNIVHVPDVDALKRFLSPLEIM